MSGLLDTAAQLASPWAYVVLALAAAAEAAAFVGVVVPGETAMLLGGFLAFQGRVSLGWMMAAGAAGAVVGDSVGYAIGRRLGEPVKRSRLGRRVGRQRWARAEAYLRAKGGRAVFLGRFVGLLRALVPALAGMSRMPYRTFLPWNLAGGVIWAPGFVLLGYLAGSSYRQVERIVGRASLLLLLVVVLAGALVVGARRFARRPDRLRALVDRQLERRWVARLRGRRTCSHATTSRCWTGGCGGLSSPNASRGSPHSCRPSPSSATPPS
jgi:membrane protein DedA with SNARE-associated domain